MTTESQGSVRYAKDLVSVIVLNWNGEGVIGPCLESLLGQTYQPREIIVVDNGSTDGSLEVIKERYQSSVILIENKKNLGFAEGVNIGIRASSGEFIALLNDDAVAEEDWIENLVKGFERAPSIGMCASKVYLTDRQKVFDNTGLVITCDGLARGRGRLEEDHGQYDLEEAVLCPSGCAALYRRKMLDEIGLFDKHFFLYAEDVDAGLRGRLLGYECLYIPTAVVHHRFSLSTGRVSPSKAFYVERNRLWVVIKCFPIRGLLSCPFYTIRRYFYHAYGLFRHKGPAARYVEKFSLLGLMLVVIRVYLSTLWFLPYLIFQRIQLMKRKKAASREFNSWLKSYGMSLRKAALNEL